MNTIHDQKELLVVVNGGPGLSSSYLRESLLALTDAYKVIFYEQLGCGSNDMPAHDITADLTVDQLERITRDIPDPRHATLLGHSWGSTLILLCHEKYGILSRFTRLILFNPAPLTRSGTTDVGERLFGRLSPSAKEGILKLLDDEPTDENGRQIMELAREGYCSPNRPLPEINFEYRRKVYEAVDTSLGDFSLTHIAIPKSIEMTLVYGSDDYIPTSATEALQPFAKRKEIIPDSGHFPFSESPDFVTAVVRSLQSG